MKFKSVILTVLLVSLFMAWVSCEESSSGGDSKDVFAKVQVKNNTDASLYWVYGYTETNDPNDSINVFGLSNTLEAGALSEISASDYEKFRLAFRLTADSTAPLWISWDMFSLKKDVENLINIDDTLTVYSSTIGWNMSLKGAIQGVQDGIYDKKSNKDISNLPLHEQILYNESIMQSLK